MAGIGEEGGKAVTGFIDALKKEPLSLALVAMNVCLLAFFYFMLNLVAAQREREIGLLYADKKEVREMLAKCVVPSNERRGDTPENKRSAEMPMEVPHDL